MTNVLTYLAERAIFLRAMAKTEHLQIRVTPRQKAAIRRRAAAAGQDMSSYVLSRAAPAAGLRFEEILRALEEPGEPRYPLAELNDFLSALTSVEFPHAVAHADVTALSPFLQNYVAAMVEHAAARRGVAPPAWTASVPPLAMPYFAAPLASLRLHLLAASPVAFKRRNLFVDSSVGARV